MAKKSKAQIRRMMQRAASRGDEYHPPIHDEAEVQAQPQQEAKGRDQEPVETSTFDQAKLAAAATKLTRELEKIEQNQELKSKERRSAKRKAEAIAAETTGMSAADLLQWYETLTRKPQEQPTKRPIQEDADSEYKSNTNPYIVFIGQLSYETTPEELFQHIQTNLEGDQETNRESIKIRLLTDPKKGKSRGMAFVEFPDPELLYACLKLHHTVLGGRRINVERTAGGGRQSEARKTRLKQLREEQEQHMDEVVTNMFQEFWSSGKIKEKELDDGVIALCKRHSASLIQAALQKYIESNGRDMDNPSAYLTFLIGKLATEGVYETKAATQDGKPFNKKRRRQDSDETKLERSSELTKRGTDMSNSLSKGNDLSKKFPSANRGRGSGR